ncbi:MAG TPA: glycerol-3-phosphate dehydrogenase/oxidase [Pyrinomonadaceae bacterium]|nr:glycerol-3-phosphate dehydrogenase/oxidase [Pyrinomonadaceae bacterium]
MPPRIPRDLAAARFDVIIVGAGINGAGVARDAAMRGLRVLLLDKGDLGGATTAWSSRLIHGGLRYLEHGELGLVRESLRERETLLRVAPHLVRPLSLLIPVYRGQRRGPLTVRAGMLAYDLLSRGKSLPRHRMLRPAEALGLAPGLNPEGLRAAALFYDAQVTYAERLAVENALDARARGATVITYARVTKILTAGGAAVGGVEFEDVPGGGVHAARAPLVLNAAGPWADAVLEASGVAGARLLGGTKGSHAVVGRSEAAPDVALYVEARADARPFFILPWDGKLLLGTTDERFEGDPGRAAPTAAEIDYILGETNRALPSARLTRESVLYAYAGVRPLAFTGARTEAAAATRRHFIRDSPLGGLFSVVGGKLTTYRSLAEEATELLFRQLGREAPPCATARTPLPGAAVADFASFSDSFVNESVLPRPSAARLLSVYGARATEVERLAREHAALRSCISEETGSVGAEVVYAFRSELAETLVDCLMRRTMTGLNSRLGLDAAARAAEAARQFLGWDDARAAREVEEYRRHVERFQVRP